MKFFIVTPLHPLNKFNGASQRIHKVISTLQDFGCETLTVYTCQDSSVVSEERRSQLERSLNAKLGRSLVLPSRYTINNSGSLNKLDEFAPLDILPQLNDAIRDFSPDAVLVNYVFLSKLLIELEVQGAKKIIDTHDKLSREEVYKSAGVKVGFFCTTEKEELEGLSRADVVLCIQDKETKYFSNAGVEKVFTIGHLLEKKYLELGKFRAPRKIGFMGSNHVFNAKSIERFCLSPKFDRLLDKYEIVFAGGICDNEVVKEAGVTLLGRVDDEREFYQSVDIVINPVFYGTGLKIKTVESLAYGVPQVGSNVAFDGIDTQSRFHLAQTFDDFFDLLDEIHTDPGLTIKLANLSKSLFEEYRSSLKASYKSLLNFLEPQNQTHNQIHIHHVVNFVEATKESDLYLAQPVTIKSLNVAKRYVETLSDEPAVIEQHAVLVGEEEVDVDLLEGVSVHRVIRNISCFPGFEAQKPLPLLSDILSCVIDKPDNHYVVYTNADISLTPIFYDYIAQKISQGVDALVINRRTLSRSFSTPEEYLDMVCDLGGKHPGYDCFVFQVQALKKYKFEKTLIGVHLVGRVLLWNLIKNSRSPMMLDASNLTFHIGDDNSGKDERNNELLIHNFESAVRVLSELGTGDFIDRLEDFSPGASRMFYQPNIFRDDIAAKVSPVFIHSMFRTGSTYLWGKINDNNNVHCYYEPLHESLSLISAENVGKFNEDAARFHDRLNFSGYWQSYTPALADDVEGIPHYKLSFAYDEYTEVADSESLISYVDYLVESCQPRRPVLQFNRTSLRQSWFSKNYPNSLNIYVFREPRSQFESYFSSYRKTNGRGFLRTLLGAVCQNLASPHYSKLLSFLPLDNLGQCQFENVSEYFSFYDHVAARFNIRQLYLLFFWDWLLGLKAAVESDHGLINTSFLSENVVYRRKVELMFAKNYLYCDFSDCSLPKYSSPELSAFDCYFIEGVAVKLLGFEFSGKKDLLASHGVLEYIPIDFSEGFTVEGFNQYLKYGAESVRRIKSKGIKLLARDRVEVRSCGVEFSKVLPAGGVDLAIDFKGELELSDNSALYLRLVDLESDLHTIEVLLNGEETLRLVNGEFYPVLMLGAKSIGSDWTLKLNIKPKAKTVRIEEIAVGVL